jgi:murein DD-endopeptidase MepM/ murein hydrolase activator NlpD
VTAKYFPLAGVPYSNIGPYGPRPTPQNPNGFHYGIDLAAPVGTPIVAVDDGTVHSGTDPMGGNVIVLHATDGRAWYHAHLSAFEAPQGARVAAGTLIGLVGRTGNAALAPSHLHLELWPSGQFQRPAPDPTAEILATTMLAAPLGSAARSMMGPLVAAAAIVGAGVAVAVAILPKGGRLRYRRRAA